MVLNKTLIDKIEEAGFTVTQEEGNIYYFGKFSSAGHIISDLVLKTKYLKDTNENEYKIESWLENRNGRKLSNIDMNNLIYRLYW